MASSPQPGLQKSDSSGISKDEKRSLKIDNVRSTGWPRSDILYFGIGTLLVVLTVIRLIPTYTIFTGTYDEPFHIASGMEWLDKGTYSYELLHPPLARVMVSVGPYLKGLRSHSKRDPTEEGNDILHSDGNYWQNLRLARLGTLPFLILACAVILLWARRWFTRATGIWALILFLNVPPVLGHAGLATLDMGCAATVCLALYCLMRWVEYPTRWQSVKLGIAFGLAFLTKFSSLGFLAAACCAVLLYYILSTGIRAPYELVRSRMWQACLAGCIVILVVWTGHRFSMAPLASPRRREAVAQYFATSPVARTFALAVSDVPVPLKELAIGVKALTDYNNEGHRSYLLGEYRKTGWWYFFPVVLGVKTPLAFLLLTTAGFVIILRRFRHGRWQHFLTAAFPLAILLVCVSANINLGVRHILAIYPLLALIAGHAIYVSFVGKRRYMEVGCVVCVLSVVANAWLAHPDYMAYFNQLAGSHPERILAESDLDWGQDLHRLSLRLKDLGVRKVAIAYKGTARLESAGLPEFSLASAFEKTTGYVAVSVQFISLHYAMDGSYGWLKQYEPVERIGKSIFLYNIEQ